MPLESELLKRDIDCRVTDVIFRAAKREKRKKEKKKKKIDIRDNL